MKVKYNVYNESKAHIIVLKGSVKVYERNEPMKKELDSNECKLVAQQSSPLTNIPIH